MGKLNDPKSRTKHEQIFNGKFEIRNNLIHKSILSKMKKFRIGLLIMSVIIIIAELIIIDYKNLFSSKNLGASLVMIGMILTIIVIVLSIKNDRKKIEKIDN